jgi:chloramphenicol 3-O-phosphotransferase
MTDNSMFSRNCNIDPAECARPFEENYEKIVVLIRGVGASGKSTLANLMLNVVEECMEEFMNFFFKKYIIENPYENIILDGYLYTYPEAYALLREKCRVYGYRLWDAKRVV